MKCYSSTGNIFIYFVLISRSLAGAFLEHRNSEIATLLHRPIRALSFPETSTMGLFLALAVPLEAPRNSVSLSYFFEATYGLPQNSTDFDPYGERGHRRKRGIDRATIYRTIENKFSRSGLRGRKCLLRTICETSECSLHHNGVLGDIINVIFTEVWRVASSRGLVVYAVKFLASPQWGRRQTLKNFPGGKPCLHVSQIGILEGNFIDVYPLGSLPLYRARENMPAQIPSTSRPENLSQDIIEAEHAGLADNCSKYYSACPVGLYDLIGILV